MNTLQSVNRDNCNSNLNKILSDVLLPPKKCINPGKKIIHDNLWGSRLFYPWEVALIDTPLLQRLRNIHQLGTAYLTYPSAVHNRFSHTLGVTILAGRLITRLKENLEVSTSFDEIISPKDIYTVRLAGLLHDVGHCFFSHASEKLLGYFFSDIIEAENIGDPKPHEFLSYLIVKCDSFKDYWDENIAKIFNKDDEVPSINDIANIIVGKPPSKEKMFLQEIINGPYDVDKLEYLFRDAQTAGLAISYDIERYFYKISVVNNPEGTWRLVMDEGGVRAVEQIIFSKMMLYSFVYHHQKVLASDLLIDDILMEILGSSTMGDIKIDHPVDMLRYSDVDILSTINKGPSDRYDEIRIKIANRYLPKRCFVINKEFVKYIDTNGNVKRNWTKLKKQLRGLPDDINEIRNAIVEKMSIKDPSKVFTIDDIYISFPKSPTMEEATSAPVVDSEGNLKSMAKYYDLDGWQKTYDLKKLRGYFYSNPDMIEVASACVEEYLFENFDLEFKDKAKIEAKVSSNSCE